MPINEMNGRSLAGVVAELKDEMKEFFSTRLAMLRSEINDKLSAWKTALPMIVIGLALLGTCWLLLTGALVAAIAVAFEGNPFAPAIALAIVGVLYAVAGGVAVVFAWRDISEHGVVPERTLRVLKDDQLWIRNQAKVQL
jgi:hypothetical protein